MVADSGTLAARLCPCWGVRRWVQLVSPWLTCARERWQEANPAGPRTFHPGACPGLGGQQMVPKAGGVEGGSDAQSCQMCCQPHSLLPPSLPSQMCHPAEASLPAQTQEPQRPVQRLPCSMEFTIQLGTASFTGIRAEVTRACFGKRGI